MALKHDPAKHTRHSIRLSGYDYAQPGAYFVTLCTHEQEYLFGNITEGEIVLNELGQTVQSVWDELPRRFPTISTDTHVIMPNHFHGIIIVGAQFIAPSSRMNRDQTGVMNHAPTLGKIVRVFKAISTRRIRTKSNSAFAWQRNYYEHIIRNEEELKCIRQYIADNPMQWEMDREKPHSW